MQQWKTLLTWKFVHEPVLESNVISSKLTPPPPPLHSHTFTCVWVCACVCVFAFQTTKRCHTVFRQACVRSTRELLSLRKEESRVWGATRPRATGKTYVPGLLAPMAAALVPFHSSILEGLQMPKREIFISTSVLEDFNMPDCLKFCHEGL